MRPIRKEAPLLYISRTSLCSLAVLTLALAACGSSSGSTLTSPKSSGTPTPSKTSSSAGKKIDACSLLSDAEAQTILGEAVTKKGPGSGVGESVCQWDATDKSMTVSVGTAGTAPNNTFTLDAAFGTPDPVPGMSGAFSLPGGQLDFAAADRHNYVQVVTDVFLPDTDRTKARQLAELLIPKITAAG